MKESTGGVVQVASRSRSPVSPLRVRQLPSTTQRFIELDDRKETVTLGLGAGYLCGEKKLLGFQDFIVARQAILPRIRWPTRKVPDSLARIVP